MTSEAAYEVNRREREGERKRNGLDLKRAHCGPGPRSIDKRPEGRERKRGGERERGRKRSREEGKTEK